MVKCKNCARKVPGEDLVCCHCGYPLAVAKVIPWPRRLWPIAPQQFWKVAMLGSLFLALFFASAMLACDKLGFTSLDCAYPLLMALSAFVWAYVGSRKSLR